MNPDYANQLLTGGRPIPGQSLTSDPGSPAPYEKPPQFTSVHEAARDVFEYLVEPEVYTQVMELLIDEVPLMEIVQSFIFIGFKEGKWNPDLMLMLIEPIAYIILALAERADIDPVIYIGEEDDEAEDIAMLGAGLQKERLENMRKFSKEEIQLPEGVVPQDIVREIETIEPPESLLASPAQEEQEVSLMARPSNEENV